MSAKRYGLRWGGIKLMWTSGGGRTRLECEGREWWGKPPAGRAEVYEDENGYFASKEEAETVADNLAKN
jgi:hypothetical protein